MAAEFATSAVANTVGNLTTEYASPYVSYFFRFGKIVEEFRNQREELESKKDRVKNDVDEAIRQTEIIEKDVQNWLIRAEKELEETQSLEAEIERKKCPNCCPSWGWRYCLSKKIAKKTLCIKKLVESCNFQRVGYRAPLQGIESFPSKDFMPSESSNSTFNEIIKALNNNGVNMIGLYGMPGVGKTTLAKEVGKHAKEQKLFDNFVMVTMTQTPDINKIQNKIAELLGLDFKASTEEGKAEELWRRLKGVKKILIIIDDVWKEFKLQTIGIPFGVEHEGCKILLTTRRHQVCVEMNCQEKFPLNILPKDEAWALFKDNAGLKDVSSTVNDVAKEVCYECMGLPLAIVTIGKALKGASLDGWTVANQRFKDSRHLDNADVCEDIYNCLQLSYDYLKGDNIRLCFLLCSLFPEDADIDIELLLKFGIGHRLFSDIDLIEDLRREIREALRKLQESGLLLKIDDVDDEYEESDDDDETYAMHDVVRDFAHWITSKEKNMFIVKEGLTKWPRSESFGCCTTISFWNNNINNFPDKLEFPELKILVFTRKNLVRVPSEFVKGMKALRILHLGNVIFSLEVFKFITKLQTLCFVDCQLENISSLRNMENLEILALSDTNIYELPEELVALHRLKSLHFSYSGNQLQSNFPPNLLSRLASLQELHVTCKNNVNLSEINSLSCLTALSLRVSTSQCFQENFVFPKLQRYMIAVNQDLRFMVGPKTLKISDFSSSLSAFKELFCNVQKLTLENVMEHKNIVPNVDQEGLNELTSLKLSRCKDLECLMDTTGEKGPTTAFSNLTSLDLDTLPELENIWKLQPTHQYHASLRSLKVVGIYNCSELKSIFSTFLAQSLLNLQHLTIANCHKLEQVFDFSQEAAELEPTHQYHASLQSLKVVCIQNCGELKSIFSTFLAQSLLNLQELTISNCHKLEQVFDFPQKAAELEPTHQYHASLQSLKVVSIYKCNELKSIFPTFLAQSLLNLQRLTISGCYKLEQVFDFPQEAAELEISLCKENPVPPLSNLTSLDLKLLPNLKCIWKLQPTHQYHASLQSLKVVSIYKCNELKSIFSSFLAQSLLNLQQLTISDCDKLEQVFDFPQEASELEISLREENPVPPLSNLTTLDLNSLPNLKCIWKLQPTHQYHASLQGLEVVHIFECNKLKSIFSTFLTQNLLNLQVLTISDCDKLEQVFDFPQEAAEFEPTHQYHASLQSLNVVRIEYCSELKSIFSTFLAKSLLNLQQLTISYCYKLEQVFYFPQEAAELEISLCEENQVRPLSNLTSLKLYSLPELKCIWKGLSHYVCLKNLKFAEIRSCERLKYLFSPSPSLAQSLVLLEQLKIEYCNGLEHIIESDGGHLHPPLLPKLTSLQINRCSSLEYVFKIPLAQGLPHLKSVSIYHAPKLKQIFNVAKEKNGVDHSIALPRLQHVYLDNLRNLSCFCSENYPIVSPSLEELTIQICPRLENFSIQQDINKQIQLKKLNLFDLRISCEKIFQIQAELILSRIEVINLYYIDQLQGPIQVANLHYLRELHVSNCNRLKSLISSMLVRNLPQLKVLSIYCCEELEEIIEIDHNSIASSSQGHLQPISFPSLKDIKIYWCSNLKSLFPISVIHSLSNLKSIEIHGTSKLDHVFGYQGELNVEDDQKGIVVPELNRFELLELQSLKNFAPMGYHFRFPSLSCFKVEGCPNLSTSFSKDSKDIVHAITKAPQQVEYNTAEGFTTMGEIVDNRPTCNDICWNRKDCPDTLPLYINAEETEHNVAQ